MCLCEYRSRLTHTLSMCLLCLRVPMFMYCVYVSMSKCVPVCVILWLSSRSPSLCVSVCMYASVIRLCMCMTMCAVRACTYLCECRSRLHSLSVLCCVCDYNVQFKTFRQPHLIFCTDLPLEFDWLNYCLCK